MRIRAPCTVKWADHLKPRTPGLHLPSERKVVSYFGSRSPEGPRPLGVSPSTAARMDWRLRNHRLVRHRAEPSARPGVESQKALSNLCVVRDDLLASAV